MASEVFEKLISMVPEGFNQPGDSVPVVRKKMASSHGHPIATDTHVEETTYGGVRAGWLWRPECEASRRVFLFCHGGGFVSCDLDSYLFYAELISEQLRGRVITPDYRLAPEHRYPAALEDCLAVYRGLLDEGIDPGQIALIGDSCGAGLALATLLRARDAGLPMAACCISLTGWFDLEASGESATHPRGRDPFITPGWLRARGRDYLGEVDPKTPDASPIHADCTGLPPLLLLVGEIDITRDDAVRMAARAGRAGVGVGLDIWPEMVHGWHGLATAGVPESLAAWRRIHEYVDRNIPK